MKKEIIIVTISLGNDGAERILTELARQWVHDGHHITVIQTSPNRYGNEYALEKGIEQIEFYARNKRINQDLEGSTKCHMFIVLVCIEFYLGY